MPLLFKRAAAPIRPTARQRHGAEGEALALAHLQQAGLTLVARNVSARGGELDLVMRDARRSPASLVFVEVRRRAGGACGGRYGGAFASVTTAKQERLARAAQAFLIERYGNCPPPCRFDVVAVDTAGAVEWLIDAFGDPHL